MFCWHDFWEYTYLVVHRRRIVHRTGSRDLAYYFAERLGGYVVER